MTSSVLGWMSQLLPGLRSTTASLQTASRHDSIAFASEGSLRGHRHRVSKPGYPAAGGVAAAGAAG